MDNKDTKLMGNITELEVLNYVTKLGYQVSLPFGDRARYDQIWDIEGKLLKIQIKTAKLHDSGNYLIISCKSSNRKNGKCVNRRYTKDDIDYLASFYNGICYLIPVEQLPGRQKILRLNKSMNNQQTNITWAEDYKIEKIIKEYILS
jgi:hypothetical protein